MMRPTAADDASAEWGGITMGGRTMRPAATAGVVALDTAARRGIMPALTVPVRIALCLLLGAAPLAAQTRIAGVQVTRAFRSYHRTKAAMQQFDGERAQLENNPLRQQVERLAAEARQAEAAAAKAPADDPEARLEAERLVQLKADELRAVTNALRESRNDRTTELNRRQVAATRELLGAVCQAAVELGRERGFDLVIDSSGNSNTGLPVIIHARNLPDLTDDVILRLNRDAPHEPEAPEAPEATGQPDAPAGEPPAPPPAPAAPG